MIYYGRRHDPIMWPAAIFGQPASKKASSKDFVQSLKKQIKTMSMSKLSEAMIPSNPTKVLGFGSYNDRAAEPDLRGRRVLLPCEAASFPPRE